jgi:hypothetical protein
MNNNTSMKNLLAIRQGLLLCLFFLITSVSFSQVDDVDFLRSIPADGVKFTQAYISPWANAFGAGLNGSWYNTAKPHKPGGFDITAGFNVGIVPSSAETFDISSLGLSSSLTGSGTTPSIAGPDNDGPLMTYKVNDVTLASFNAPPGLAWKYIPVPTLQVGIGLPFGTELKGRFIPKIEVQGGNISLWGLGIVHSITQYLPGNKMLPFDVSLFAGYTKLQGSVPLSLEPDPAVGQNYVSFDPASAFENQALNVSVEALNVSAIASLNLPVITFYGGLGYSKTRTEMDLSGYFPIPVLVTPAAPALPYAQYNDSGVRKGSDFPNMDIRNFSGLRANIGLRIKLTIITIHFDYTRAQYNVLSAGLGISIR